ncbi:MAG TPA: response regulator [Anaerolineales bacterium]|jgi:CheY-like chemotaxis protein
MDQTSFTSLFRDLIAHIYDRVAIENHPLAAHFLIPPDSKLRRADVIRQLILDEIENLRPDGPEVLWQSPEWRPYLILNKRYVEAQDPSEIARSLYIGDRQFRRDHSRALQALSARIWDGHFTNTQAGENSDGRLTGEEQQDFEFHPEQLDLGEIIEGVVSLSSRLIESEHVRLQIELPTGGTAVFTDRVVLRQILLSLLNYVLHLRKEPVLILRAKTDSGLVLSLSFETDEQWASIRSDEQGMLEFLRKLSLRLPARLEEAYPPPGLSGPAAIQLIFDRAKTKSVLMVDDQPATLKMFQRYLSGTSLEVTGLSDPGMAVETARLLQPALILLDVMMPRIDGWEVLQALQLDPQTKNIPIIVCSAWGEPELARSLGAAEFLKKPVIQKDLLAALTRLAINQG